MVLVLDWVLVYILTSVFTLLSAVYLYSRHIYGYFKRRGIPYEEPTFPFGSLTSVITLRHSYIDTLFRMHKKNKGKQFVGFFQLFKKSVLIIDRELIKQVLVKDFEHFNLKNIHHDKEVEPLSAHLFALDGTEWKHLRMKVNPAFSSGKVKAMYETVADVGLKLNEYIDKLSAETDVIEFKDVFIRYGIAMISSTAFGIESDVFKDKSSLFYTACTSIMPPNITGMFRNSLMFFGKDLAKTLKLRIIPRNTHDFIMKLVTDMVQYREENNVDRKDFLQLLIQMKEGVKVENKDLRITMDELAAQAYIFILAGFETMSNTLSFFMYEMAMNPKVQERVFDEVSQHEAITYDTLASMEYLDMAIDETLRKHPPAGFLGRVCSKDYLVSGTNDVIEKGTQVMISTHGLHWDPDLFPDPELFIPERFNKENKSDIKPFSYMPFGDGPRFCIGMRFARLAMKSGLVMLLRKYHVEKTSRTPNPLKYDVYSISNSPKGGMWLRLVPRTTEVVK